MITWLARSGANTPIRRATVNIPEQNGLVLTTRRETACFVRVPSQTEAFLLMADQFDLWVRSAGWSQAVLGAIENQNLAIHRQCRDYVGILWLVTRLVDLARVVNLLGNGKFDNRGLARR